jgi:hypothetical protein
MDGTSAFSQAATMYPTAYYNTDLYSPWVETTNLTNLDTSTWKLGTDALREITTFKSYKKNVEELAKEATSLEKMAEERSKRLENAQKIIEEIAAKDATTFGHSDECFDFLKICNEMIKDHKERSKEEISAAWSKHDKLHSEVSHMREAVLEVAKELAQDSPQPDALSCPICYVNPIRMCYATCGHTTCKSCSATHDMIYGRRCPICRTISEKRTLYFLGSGD